MYLYRITPVSFFTLLMISAIAGCGGQPDTTAKTPMDHEDHSTHDAKPSAESKIELIVSSIPAQPRVGDAVELRIMLHDAAGQMLKNFEPTHTKLAHLIIVREGLDEFAHLHPAVEESGTLKANYTFNKSGSYLIFLDHKPVGKPVATARNTLLVAGDSGPAVELTPNVPGHVVGDGLQAEVAMSASPEGARVVSFKVQDESGNPVQDLQPYLGAMGHLVVLSADGSQYVHAHPLTESAADGKVEFEAHFPGPGTYKCWGQFQRGDRVYTIPAIVKVDSHGTH